MNRTALAEVWREYLNDYLSLEKFAEHKGLTAQEAEWLLKVAQSAHENPHPEA
jgi:hypothetical protein